jgi:hypothetical protein
MFNILHYNLLLSIWNHIYILFFTYSLVKFHCSLTIQSEDDCPAATCQIVKKQFMDMYSTLKGLL